MNIEAERYQYLGQTTMLNKEYSDKGSPYAEYYIANNQVVSQKMFGLHGLITPGKDETLKTNGGLMYYQYDRGNTVTELTNRHGDVIEHYRYDAFGNIFTGITAPYNTTGYTGQEYDDMAGLVQMDARWYSPNIGRFMSEDTYKGDINLSQSLNRYAYAMNNPVNMWDPTGHSGESIDDYSWLGKDYYYTTTPDNTSLDNLYLIDKEKSGSSSSGWYLIDKITTSKHITYKYMATRTNTWVYDHYDYKDGGTEYKLTTETFSETHYDYNDVVISAQEIAHENEQYIKKLAGDPPKNTDTPAVKIINMQVGSGPVKLLNPDQIIVQNTGKKTTGTQSLVAGAVQSELNRVFDEDLKVDGWYGSGTAGAVADFQKSVGLTANGKLDVKTFYQLQKTYTKYVKNKKVTDSVIITEGTGLTDNLSDIPTTSAQVMEGTGLANNISDIPLTSAQVFESTGLTNNIPYGTNGNVSTQIGSSNNITGNVINSTIEGVADAVLVDGIIKNLDEVKHVTAYIPPLGPAAQVSKVVPQTGVKAIKSISKFAGPIAVASYGYDIYQDINKYDGVDAAKAVTVTSAATGVTIGGGLIASGIGAPVGVVVIVGVGLSVGTTIVADRVKKEWIGE